MRKWGRGEDDSPVKHTGDAEVVKSMGHSTTLPKDTTDRNVIESFVLLLAEKVGARLRRGRFLGRTVTTTVRYSDFQTVSKSQTIAEPVDDGLVVSQIALKILDQLRPTRPIRLLGVSVSNLIPATVSPFLLETLEKGRLLTEAMDEVNGKYGRGTLRRAKVMDAEKFGVLEAPIPPSMHSFS
jgi:DNA polymerase-4